MSAAQETRTEILIYMLGRPSSHEGSVAARSYPRAEIINEGLDLGILGGDGGLSRCAFHGTAPSFLFFCFQLSHCVIERTHGLNATPGPVTSASPTRVLSGSVASGQPSSVGSVALAAAHRNCGPAGLTDAATSQRRSGGCASRSRAALGGGRCGGTPGHGASQKWYSTYADCHNNSRACGCRALVVGPVDLIQQSMPTPGQRTARRADHPTRASHPSQEAPPRYHGRVRLSNDALQSQSKPSAGPTRTAVGMSGIVVVSGGESTALESVGPPVRRWCSDRQRRA